MNISYAAYCLFLYGTPALSKVIELMLHIHTNYLLSMTWHTYITLHYGSHSVITDHKSTCVNKFCNWYLYNSLSFIVTKSSGGSFKPFIQYKNLKA